jgi:P27 family predicted phage terminase small subunit
MKRNRTPRADPKPLAARPNTGGAQSQRAYRQRAKLYRRVAAALTETGRLGAWDEGDTKAVKDAILELASDWAAFVDFNGADPLSSGKLSDPIEVGAMRGRKPVVPPLDNVHELPTARIPVPAPPDYLHGTAREVWTDVARVLVERNIYDTDCEHMLAAFSAMYARFLDAEADIAKRGEVFVVGDKPTANLNVRIGRMAFDRAARLASELGLTPVSRSRVSKVRLPLNKYLRGG